MTWGNFEMWSEPVNIIIDNTRFKFGEMIDIMSVFFSFHELLCSFRALLRFDHLRSLQDTFIYSLILISNFAQLIPDDLNILRSGAG